jgi:CO dehydrogenase/acetyl-CoA synthase epsilon subunit
MTPKTVKAESDGSHLTANRVARSVTTGIRVERVGTGHQGTKGKVRKAIQRMTEEDHIVLLVLGKRKKSQEVIDTEVGVMEVHHLTILTTARKRGTRARKVKEEEVVN